MNGYCVSSTKSNERLIKNFQIFTIINGSWKIRLVLRFIRTWKSVPHCCKLPNVKLYTYSTIVFVGSGYHNVHMESEICSEFACSIIVSSLYSKTYQIHKRLVTFCLYVINWQLIRGFQQLIQNSSQLLYFIIMLYSQRIMIDLFRAIFVEISS